MRRPIAIAGVVGALLMSSGARAATPSGIPPLLPQLVPPHLLAEVGGPVPARPVFESGFTVTASHGYRVRVLTFGSAVILDVIRSRRHRLTVAAYLARGVAAPRRLQATFGGLGKVAMRFRPAGEGRAESACRRGERLSRQRGDYVGRVVFRGEDGYLTLDRHRAKGSIVTPAGSCRRRHRRTGSKGRRAALPEPVTGLFAGSREGVARTSFLGISRRRGASFLAVREETHGRLAIVRVAIVKGKGFHANEAVTAASLSPPAPFQGTGRYRAAPDGTATWSGSLSVDFPGAPNFPLTGPGFEALLGVPF